MLRQLLLLHRPQKLVFLDLEQTIGQFGVAVSDGKGIALQIEHPDSFTFLQPGPTKRRTTVLFFERLFEDRCVFGDRWFGRRRHRCTTEEESHKSSSPSLRVRSRAEDLPRSKFAPWDEPRKRLLKRDHVDEVQGQRSGALLSSSPSESKDVTTSRPLFFKAELYMEPVRSE